ncbi:MAG: methylated-DNA--[protein]-cysteine S-methyltransferase [Bdellovibrionia bacterium]
MNKMQWLMQSKIGPLYLVASEVALQGVFWIEQAVPLAKGLEGPSPQAKILARAVRQLNEYLDGKRREFDLPLNATGTDFQKQVWKELSRIPYGKTRSYRDIAQKIENDKAVRAVGTANGRNPLSIIVPCHRVIAADGTLGGYAGGLEIKIQLLELEARSLIRVV